MGFHGFWFWLFPKCSSQLLLATKPWKWKGPHANGESSNPWAQSLSNLWFLILSGCGCLLCSRIQCCPHLFEESWKVGNYGKPVRSYRKSLEIIGNLGPKNWKWKGSRTIGPEPFKAMVFHGFWFWLLPGCSWLPNRGHGSAPKPWSQSLWNLLFFIVSCSGCSLDGPDPQNLKMEGLPHHRPRVFQSLGFSWFLALAASWVAKLGAAQIQLTTKALEP